MRKSYGGKSVVAVHEAVGVVCREEASEPVAVLL